MHKICTTASWLWHAPMLSRLCKIRSSAEKKKTQTLTSRAIRRHTGSVGESAGRNETVNSFPPGSAALHKASSVGLCRETGADKVHVVRDYLRVHQFARSESRPRRRSPLVHLWSRQYEFSVAFLFWKTLKKSFIFIYLSVFLLFIINNTKMAAIIIVISE